MSAAIEKLNNLEMNEQITIETAVGTITVQKIWHGAEAWISGESIPVKAIGVRCTTPLEAFNHQLEIGKQYAAPVEADEIDSRFIPLTYAACFAASLRFAALVFAGEILSANFDKTLFAVSVGNRASSQTIHYPENSDQVFGFCDCLRFRNERTPCEHLTLIALDELFASDGLATYAA